MTAKASEKKLPKPKVYQLDATNQILGRFASRVAFLLQGKNEKEYQPNKVLPIIVQIKNADKIKVTGKKLEEKEYKRFSGYPGGLKSIKLKDLLNKDPKKVIILAVSRMLPKNRLQKRMLKNLKFIA